MAQSYTCDLCEGEMKKRMWTFEHTKNDRTIRFDISQRGQKEGEAKWGAIDVCPACIKIWISDFLDSEELP